MEMSFLLEEVASDHRSVRIQADMRQVAIGTQLEVGRVSQQLRLLERREVGPRAVCLSYAVLLAGEVGDVFAVYETWMMIGRAKSEVADAQLVGDIVKDGTRKGRIAEPELAPGAPNIRTVLAPACNGANEVTGGDEFDGFIRLD